MVGAATTGSCWDNAATWLRVATRTQSSAVACDSDLYERVNPPWYDWISIDTETFGDDFGPQGCEALVIAMLSCSSFMIDALTKPGFV